MNIGHFRNLNNLWDIHVKYRSTLEKANIGNKDLDLKIKTIVSQLGYSSVLSKKELRELKATWIRTFAKTSGEEKYKTEIVTKKIEAYANKMFYLPSFEGNLSKTPDLLLEQKQELALANLKPDLEINKGIVNYVNNDRVKELAAQIEKGFPTIKTKQEFGLYCVDFIIPKMEEILGPGHGEDMRMDLACALTILIKDPTFLPSLKELYDESEEVQYSFLTHALISLSSGLDGLAQTND